MIIGQQTIPAVNQRLPLVRKALGALFQRIRASDLRSAWRAFETPERPNPGKSDEILYIQWAAKLVAGHYHLPHTTFVVSRNSAIKATAQVEVRRSNEIFVDYNYSGILDVDVLWAVMAHEVAHIFLDRLSLRFDDTLENEVLTDSAVILLGFGCHYLSAQKEVISYPSNGQRVSTTKTLGYISPIEMGYVLAHREFITEEKSFDNISSGVGKTGYTVGRQWFDKEKNLRPYVHRSLFDQTMYRLGWNRVSEKSEIVFECLLCKQAIRIPALHRTLEVKCPNCRERFTCYS